MKRDRENVRKRNIAVDWCWIQFDDCMTKLCCFNSLYPSIIQEYNLCFTTVPHYKEQGSSQQKQKQQAQASEKQNPAGMGGFDLNSEQKTLENTPT